MATTLAGSALERMLDSVAECFTPETSRRLAELPADPEVRRRLGELGERSSAGTLTPAEAEEYRTLVEAGDFIATLRLRAGCADG
jgi:hypothetical protein